MTGRITWIGLRRATVLPIGVPTVVAWAMTRDNERWDGLWMATVLIHRQPVNAVSRAL